MEPDAYRYTPKREDPAVAQQRDRDERAHARRASGNVGLTGRLTLAFAALITLAIGASCWIFADQSGAQLDDMMGEQARLVAYTIAQAAPAPLMEQKTDALRQIGHSLLNTRDVLYVAFVDAQKKPLALANRYVDFTWDDVSPIGPDALSLHMVAAGSGKTFGDYVNVFAPVVAPLNAIAAPAALSNKTRVKSATTAASKSRLLGFVVVGVSLDREHAQLRWINWLIAGIGLTLVLISVPVAYILVYGVLKPIRQLVSATREIALGRFNVEIQIDRDDTIGELAESFQDMVNQVRRQREDLAQTNVKLADANGLLGEANQKLAEANRDLEQKVSERTAQLATANHRLSAEIAEKEDFLRAVSHDLNAPLRNIAGMAGMLLSKHGERFDEDITHRLQRIQKNVEAETDLIGELLELSRIKSRRLKLEPVDLDALVRDIGEVFEEDLRSRGIQLMLDAPLPVITVEKARIRQVFQNLIDNA
ncbi:MAG TPA: HAMP domain-containing protein, partial [Tepidisphaeraceae bacterium]|nr:HAMP domain-containing protein [Tepidisphaeraceae bacterium]